MLFKANRGTVPTKYTQGNYATQDSSGMCRLMLQRHLPEWKEEDERAFVHRDIWISNKGLDNTMQAIVNCILHEVNWQVEKKPGGRGRGREWATLRVHPLSWLLSKYRLQKVPFVSVPRTSSNRLLLSNQDKGCTPSVAHSLTLPLGPTLLNLWTIKWRTTPWKAVWQTRLDVIAWFGPELPRCTNAR